MSDTPLEVSSKEEAKTVTIIVNGRQKTVPKNEELSFDAIIALAFDNPPTGEGFNYESYCGSSTPPGPEC